jgi:hypothetical protein
MSWPDLPVGSVALMGWVVSPSRTFERPVSTTGGRDTSASVADVSPSETSNPIAAAHEDFA